MFEPGGDGKCCSRHTHDHTAVCRQSLTPQKVEHRHHDLATNQNAPPAQLHCGAGALIVPDASCALLCRLLSNPHLLSANSARLLTDTSCPCAAAGLVGTLDSLPAAGQTPSRQVCAYCLAATVTLLHLPDIQQQPILFADITQV